MLRVMRDILQSLYLRSKSCAQIISANVLNSLKYSCHHGDGDNVPGVVAGLCECMVGGYSMSTSAVNSSQIKTEPTQTNK